MWVISQGNPPPPFHHGSHMQACVYTFLRESLRLCRQSGRSQTSQCLCLRKRVSCWQQCIGTWGILVSAIRAIRPADVMCMPPNTVQHLCPLSPNAYTLHLERGNDGLYAH